MQIWYPSVEDECWYLSINQTSRCSHIIGYSCNPRDEEFPNWIQGLHLLPEATCLNTGPGDFVSRKPLCLKGSNQAQPGTTGHRVSAESHLTGGPAATHTVVLAHSPDWISADHAFILRRALKWIFHWFPYSTSAESPLLFRDNTLKLMAAGECGNYTISELS